MKFKDEIRERTKEESMVIVVDSLQSALNNAKAGVKALQRCYYSVKSAGRKQRAVNRVTFCVTMSVEMSHSSLWGNLWVQDCNISAG